MRRRGWWTVAAALLLALSLGLGSRLALRTEASDFLPRGSAPDPRPLLGDVGGSDRLVVIIDAPHPMSAAEVGPVLDSLARRLRGIAGVRAVQHRLPPALERYVRDEAARRLLLYFAPAELDTVAAHLSRAWMERALLGEHGGVKRSRLALAMGVMHTDPLDVIDPALAALRRASGTTHLHIVDGYFALPDQRAYFLTVEPAHALGSLDSARALDRAVAMVLREARADPALAPTLAGKRLLAAGRPVAYAQGFALAMADVQRVSVVSLVLVLGLLILALRRLIAPAFIMGTVLYGLAVTAALAYLVYGTISLLGWLFIAALIGFGDEFALYVITHYWVTAPPGASREEALAEAMRRPGAGILLGGLTSAAAFFSLITLSYPVMIQLAWLSTAGLLLILACSFTVLPLALAYTHPGRAHDRAWFRFTGLATSVAQRRGGAWLAVWAVLVALALWAGRTIRFEPHPWNVVVRGIPASAELDTLQQRLGASFTPVRMVSRGHTAEEALAADRAAVDALDRIRTRAGVAAVLSLSRWVPPADQQRANAAYVRAHADVFSPARFRADFAAVAARMPSRDTLLLARYVPLVSRYLTSDPQLVTLDTLRRLGLDELIDQHLARRGDEWLAVSDVFLTRPLYAAGVVDRFTGTIERDGGPALARVIWVSDALRGATHPAVLRRDILFATGLATVLTVLVLVARFRRADLVLLCLVPLVCGLALALGAMAMLGMELNLVTLAAAPLIVGLGSDDGIHIVDRLERGEGLGQVIHEAGTPMIITTLTTIAGFACFVAARFPDARALGFIASFGLVVCLVASLTVVPVGYRLLRRRGEADAESATVRPSRAEVTTP